MKVQKIPAEIQQALPTNLVIFNRPATRFVSVINESTFSKGNLEPV
jgi:hypothetical protein